MELGRLEMTQTKACVTIIRRGLVHHVLEVDLRPTDIRLNHYWGYPDYPIDTSTRD